MTNLSHPSDLPSGDDNLTQRLRSHLTHIVRQRDPYLSSAGHFYVKQYLQEQLAQWGEVIHHTFQVRGQNHHNLILTLPAQDSSDRPAILIGAHYDAVPGTPGADDNASGVAALLELARAFAAEAIAHPIQIVAFDMEEYGMLGSAAYAAELAQQQVPLRLMLSLEMLGYRDPTPGSQQYPAGLQLFYPDRGDFIALVGNLASVGDLQRLSHTLRETGVPCEWLPAGQRGMVVPQTRLSDHAPFWDEGYRAMMVTDTAFMRNPHYHQASDRLDTLDLDFLTGVCKGLEQGLRYLP
ncbi:MAG: M20/M25/M40 family metallo-hydrolase [Synechococcales bacterium]|nr:M20/M25/M40 family metallo-hydrolase [Synechococcales bacterium]